MYFVEVCMTRLKLVTIALILSLSLTWGSTTYFGVSASPLAALTPPNLGTATSFAVLAGSAVADLVHPSVITGLVGLSPAAGTFYLPPPLTPLEVSGTIYAVDNTGPAGTSGDDPALVNGAQNDLGIAYTQLQNETPVISTYSDLSGQTLIPGIYVVTGAATNLAGSPLTLNGQGDGGSIFIFKASSSLITSSGSVVRLINGAQPCNVWWQVTSSMTLGTTSTFVGNVVALTSIDDAGGSTVQGRLLARNGQVTLRHTTITRADCSATGGGGSGSGRGGGPSSSAVSGLPNSGGGPIRNEEFPWGLVLGGVFGVIVLGLGALSYYRRTHLPK